MGVIDFAVLATTATGITKAVDWVRTRFDKSGHAPKDLWIALAVLFGVGFAVGTQVNALAGFSFHGVVINAWAGEIATGLALGGMASGFHEGFDALSGAAKALHTIKRVQESKAGIGGTRPGDEADLGE